MDYLSRILFEEIKVLTAGSGVDGPVVLFLEVRNGQYKIADIKDSGNGWQLVKINFPPDIQRIILDLDNSPEAFRRNLFKISGSGIRSQDIF